MSGDWAQSHILPTGISGFYAAAHPPETQMGDVHCLTNRPGDDEAVLISMRVGIRVGMLGTGEIGWMVFGVGPGACI